MLVKAECGGLALNFVPMGWGVALVGGLHKSQCYMPSCFS